MDPLVIWTLIFVITAVVLFAVEILVPSGGIIGTVSFTCVIGAVVCLFLIDATYGWIGLVISIFLVPAAIGLGLKIFPNTPIGRLLILRDSQQADEHVRYSSDPSEDSRDLLGRRGKVVSDLRPVGVVDFGEGRRVDCLGDRGVIESGTTVEVVSVAGIEVRVRPVDPAES